MVSVWTEPPSGFVMVKISEVEWLLGAVPETVIEPELLQTTPRGPGPVQVTVALGPDVLQMNPAPKIVNLKG